MSEKHCENWLHNRMESDDRVFVTVFVNRESNEGYTYNTTEIWCMDCFKRQLNEV